MPTAQRSADLQTSVAPAIGDRRAPVAAERLRPELDARRRLPALVLRPVDHLDCAFDDVAVEPVARQLLARAVLLDVRLEDPVERRIGRKRVLVELVGAKL